MISEQHKKHKILIIEDQVGLNKLIKRKLERLGYECLQAYTGETALNIIRKNSGKIVLLMDYLLEDMNSVELIMTLKDEHITPPFIAMTGQGNENIAVELMKLGAKDYMTKNEEFLNLLPKVLYQVIENITKDEKLKEAEEKINFLGLITKQTTDTIFATDMNFNITYANPAASKLYKYTEEEFLSMNIKAVIGDKYIEEHKTEMLDVAQTDGFWEYEAEHYRRNKIEFFAHIKISPLFKDRKLSSFIFIIRDITVRKEREHEREKLIRELSSALNKIKTLEGLIPICAGCKKIRTDGGYWEEVEIYMREHSKADFTHGLCPTCTKEMYPDIYEKLKDDGKIK